MQTEGPVSHLEAPQNDHRCEQVGKRRKKEEKEEKGGKQKWSNKYYCWKTLDNWIKWILLDIWEDYNRIKS